MATQNTRSVTLALMIVAVTASLYGGQYALADGAALAERLEKYEQKIERLAEEAIQTGNVTTSEILERLGEGWIEKYDNMEHFETSERAIRAYIDRNLDADGPDSQNALLHLKVQNFETITGSVGAGHEVALLVAEYEKLRGTYEPSDPVRRYHEWIDPQYETPESQKEIQARLVKLVGDEKFLDLAFGHAESFDGLAENGSVPVELVNTDMQYWIFVANVAQCESRPDCDASAMGDGRPATSEELAAIEMVGHEADSPPGLLDSILPKAYALSKVYVDYDLYAYLNVNSCYYNNCVESWHEGGQNGPGGIDEVNYGTPPEHAYRDAVMYFYGSACDTYSGSQNVINRVETTPYLANQLRTQYTVDGVSINSCASALQYITAEHDWILGIRVESPGSFYWVH